MEIKMRLFNVEHCLNGRTHVWLFGIKILSWGHRRVKPYKNPRLGISYSVWDGEELLEQSIKQVRNTADYINVVWQKLSWYGKPCNPGLEKLLLKLKNRGLIDELIFFEPDLSLDPSYNEINKRNVGLRAARRAGCTHFMTMDTDEFYKESDFKRAYDDIIKRNLSHTFCNTVAYASPTLRYRDYSSFFVAFICRIDRHEKLELACFYKNIPILIDPTRQIPIKHKSRMAILGDIVMHHMSQVRNDINKKYDNSSANTKQRSDFASDLRNVKKADLISVPNQFGIELGN